MVTLSVEGSTGSVLTYRVRKESITIGAASSNDVVVRAPGVAPKHLVLQRTGDRFTFITQSRQTVVLNGERRSRGVLRVGDRVRVGTAVLVFQGIEEEDGETDTPQETIASQDGAGSPAPVSAAGARKELVVYNETSRLAEARQELVQLFRATRRQEVLPSLRGFFERFFPGSQTMLAWMDGEGRLQPLASNWTEDPPEVPGRAFEELRDPGRYAVLRRGYRETGIWPVIPDGWRPAAYLLVEAPGELGESDRTLASEVVTLLAAHWEGVENTGSLYASWEDVTRQRLAEELPGTSRSIELLRENVLAAAKGHDSVLIAGRPGSGRTFAATLIAQLHPAGALPFEIVQGREGDPEALRAELFGGPGRGEGVTGRVQGGVVIVRDVHLLPVATQREIAAAIQASEGSGASARVRWIVTVPDNLLEVVNEGRLEPALFSATQTHLLSVPSLASRKEDLPLIVVRLLDLITAEQGKTVRGIALETLNDLLGRSWEGEMAELLGELRRLVSATPSGEMVRGDSRRALPADTGSLGDDASGRVFTFLEETDDLKVVVPAVERLLIDRVLRRVKGNQSKAARILNISRGALIAKVKEYDIPDYRYLRRQRG